MRIRKRQVPLPLSLLSPVPISDPHLLPRSPVQPDSNPTSTDHLDSDLGAHTPPAALNKQLLEFEQGKLESDKAKNSNDISKGSMPAADESNNGVLLLLQPPHLSSNQAASRWCYDDKTVPLKKRIRGTFQSLSQSDAIESKINKTESVQENETAKKSKRGSMIMEGSRCSRVNGRGWRCCQPTLVGYSLCEHHLGKGRLRSMNNIRSANRAKNANPERKTASSSLDSRGNHEQDDVVEYRGGEHEEKLGEGVTLTMSSSTKKRVKLGMVKARSLSSLLGQTNGQDKLVDQGSDI